MSKPDCSTTFAPPSAIRVWSDTRFIYAEIPTKDGGVPLIIKHAHAEAGLTKVLALMKKQALEYDPKGGFYAIPTPKITPPSKPATYTESQRTTARDILKKMGIV